MTESRLPLGRAEILAHRRLVGSLDERMPGGETSLRRAAWAGLQDSMPRAALLSIHARVERTTSTAWEDAPLVQIWGPRYSAYVIAAADLAVFTVGRLPDDPGSRRAAEDIATRLDSFLAGSVMGADEAARGIGVRHPNALRYGAPTGRIDPLGRCSAADDLDKAAPHDRSPRCRPGTRAQVHPRVRPGDPGSVRRVGGRVAGGRAHQFRGTRAVAHARPSPYGDGWILAADQATFRAPAPPGAAARFLPSGDTFSCCRAPTVRSWSPTLTDGRCLDAARVARRPPRRGRGRRHVAPRAGRRDGRAMAGVHGDPTERDRSRGRIDADARPARSDRSPFGLAAVLIHSDPAERAHRGGRPPGQAVRRRSGLPRHRSRPRSSRAGHELGEHANAVTTAAASRRMTIGEPTCVGPETT